MSLPTKAYFFHGDKLVCKSFANIGWFFCEDLVPRTVRESAQHADLKDDDWTHVELYGETYTKPQLNKIIIDKRKR